MSLSSVAGILDGYGGWHTVVALRKSLRHHVRPGQLLLVVPDYKVKEPVPWNNIPGLIRHVELHILWGSTAATIPTVIAAIRGMGFMECCRINPPLRWQT